MENKSHLRLYNLTKILMIKLVKAQFKYKTIGLENIPDVGGVVLAGNHISNYDPLLVSLTNNRPISFIAKKELFKYKISNWFFRKLGAIPVDRKNPGVSTIRESVKVLKSGNMLGIFPEGTRNKNGGLLPFKGGAEKIAQIGKSPIVPFSITGKYNHKDGITLEYGEPIYLDKLDIEKNEYSKYVEDKVKKLVLKNTSIKH